MLAGGTIPLRRRYSTIWPYSSPQWMTAPLARAKRGPAPLTIWTVSAAFSGVRVLAARWPTANESFRNWTISALVFSSSGPLVPLMVSGNLSPLSAVQKRKFALAVCLISWAKVRTPLNSLPLMLRLSGVKLNLSSGMASAASTMSFSYWLTWRSTMEEMLAGGGAGVAWAWGAGVAWAAGAAP